LPYGINWLVLTPFFIILDHVTWGGMGDSFYEVGFEITCIVCALRLKPYFVFLYVLVFDKAVGCVERKRWHQEGNGV